MSEFHNSGLLAFISIIFYFPKNLKPVIVAVSSTYSTKKKGYLTLRNVSCVALTILDTKFNYFFILTTWRSILNNLHINAILTWDHYVDQEVILFSNYINILRNL